MKYLFRCAVATLFSLLLLLPAAADVYFPSREERMEAGMKLAALALIIIAVVVTVILLKHRKKGD